MQGNAGRMRGRRAHNARPVFWGALATCAVVTCLGITGCQMDGEPTETEPPAMVAPDTVAPDSVAPDSAAPNHTEPEGLSQSRAQRADEVSAVGTAGTVVLLEGRRLTDSRSSFHVEMNGERRWLEVVHHRSDEGVRVALEVRPDAPSRVDPTRNEALFALEFWTDGIEQRWIERVPGTSLHMSRRELGSEVLETYGFDGLPSHEDSLVLAFDRNRMEDAGARFQSWYPRGNPVDYVPEGTLISQLLAGRFEYGSGFAMYAATGDHLDLDDLPQPGDVHEVNQYADAACAIADICRLLKCLFGGASNTVCLSCTIGSLICMFINISTWGGSG